MFPLQRRRDRLEIIAFDPDRLTAQDGVIRTHLIIHNPAVRDNRITAFEVAVRDPSAGHRLDVTLCEDDLPCRSTARIDVVACSFRPKKLSRECICRVDMTDAFGGRYHFEQPFLNLSCCA